MAGLNGLFMAKIANINDIARLAGVSRSTVSRVLTNNKNVKPETALKVKRAMQVKNILLICRAIPNYILGFGIVWIVSESVVKVDKMFA